MSGLEYLAGRNSLTPLSKIFHVTITSPRQRDILNSFFQWLNNLKGQVECLIAQIEKNDNDDAESVDEGVMLG